MASQTFRMLHIQWSHLLDTYNSTTVLFHFSITLNICHIGAYRVNIIRVPSHGCSCIWTRRSMDWLGSLYESSSPCWNLEVQKPT